MIKKGTRYLLLPLLFVSMCVCAGALSLKPVRSAKHSAQKPSPKSAPGHIISFKISQQIAAEVIDETQHFIAINIHAGINITSITPTITLDQPTSTVSPGNNATQDFSAGPIDYVVDGVTLYSVNLYAAHTLPAICNNQSILIPGDGATPAGTLLWEMLNTTTGLWVTAPGATNTAPNYQTASLANATSSPKVYTFRRSITAVGTTYDSYYDITVNPSTAISGGNINNPAVTTFCVSGDPGTITGLPVSGGIGTYTYQWQSSVNGGPFTDINTATGPDYTPGGINTTTSFRRVTTSGTCTAPKTSNVVTITIQNAITNNHLFQPGTINFCSPSGTVSMQGNTPSGGAGTANSFSYQWQSCTDGVNFANIPGTAAQKQDYISPSVTQTTYFRRMAASGACSILVPSDDVITITIESGIANNTISDPAVTKFCGGGAPGPIPGLQPSGGDGTNYTYMWQQSVNGGGFTNIQNSNVQSYNPGTVTQTTTYQRTVTSDACNTPSISGQVTITIQQPIGNNTIPQPPQTGFCSSVAFGPIDASVPTGGDGVNYTYQWQISHNGGPMSVIPNSNVQKYDPGTITQNTTFQRIVLSSGSCNTPLLSNLLTITVSPPVTNNNLVSPPTASFCGSGSPGLITGPEPTGGDGPHTYLYQWQSSVNGGPMTDITNAIADSYDPGVVTQTTVFQRSVTSGNCTTPVPSNPITIIVQPALSANTITRTGTTSFCTTGDPTVINGSPVTGGDGTPVYQWESSTDGTNYQPINSTDQQNYDPPPVSVTTYFRRQVSSGSCSPPTPSAPVTITVTPSITANVIHADNTLFCASTGTFTITGDPPAGGDGSYTYKWQSSTDGITYQPVNGVVSASYDSPSLTETTWFERIVSSGSCNAASISTPVKITVQTVLGGNTLTLPPVSAFCGPGDAGLITGATPTGGDGSPSYQWQQSPDNVDAHFTNISGVGASGKDFDPPSLNSTMFYRRVVTEQTCNTPLISTAVEIHITQPLDPTKNHITPPLTTTFCTSYDPNTIIGNFGNDINGKLPTGVDAIVYKWYKSTDNGANWIPITVNGDSPDYDPDPITVTTWYMRTVRSGACATEINSVETVKLNIIDSPPNITISPAAPICAGQQATLSIASPDAALTYIWYDSPTKDNALYQGPVFKTAPLTGNQTFYAEASNGTCSSPQLASVDVTVNPLPDLPVLADAKPAGCEGSPLVLTVSNPQNGITYKWYSAATGGQSLFTGPDFTTPVLTDDVTYYVDATSSSGCVSPGRASAAITVYPLPVTVAQGASICPGTIATLTANNQGPEQTINWYDAPTGGMLVGTGSPFKTPVLNTGTTYYAEAVNTVSGCISATRSAAKVQILTPLDAPVVRVIASAAPKMIFAWAPVNGAVAYLVSTDNGISYTDPSSGPDGTSHTVTGLQVGQTATIIVRALGNSSCETSADSSPVMGIATDPDIDKIFVANAFTPNGDGKNDIVYVHNDNIKSLKFSVYDQWGNMLFQSLSPQKGWDGTYKGKLQPVGVYVYYLEAVMNDGQPVTKKGTITLLR